MITVFILFVLLVAIILLPSQLRAQKEKLKEVELSLFVRLDQLKKDFIFRTKELRRRLQSADLAEDEWQKLTDELKTDTETSIDLTKTATENQQTKVSRIFSLIILLIVIGVSAVTYHYAGSYKQVKQQIKITEMLKNDPEAIDRLNHEAQEGNSQHKIDELYLALRIKVEMFPSSIPSWLDLATFNASYGRTSEAKSTMKIAMGIEPENLDLKVDMARILSYSKDREDVFESLKLINDVLIIKSNHEGALLMLAEITFQFGLYEKAISSWKTVSQFYELTSDMGLLLQERIEIAEQAMTAKANDGIVAQSSPEPTIALTSVPLDDTAVSSTIQLKVRVVIPDVVRLKLKGDESLFIFAKAVSGPRFPIAVIKTTVDALTDEIILTDANAMRPEFALSKYDAVILSARISFSGTAVAQSGDIQGLSDVIQAPFPKTTITLIVDKRVD